MYTYQLKILIDQTITDFGVSKFVFQWTEIIINGSMIDRKEAKRKNINNNETMRIDNNTYELSEIEIGWFRNCLFPIVVCCWSWSFGLSSMNELNVDVIVPYIQNLKRGVTNLDDKLERTKWLRVKVMLLFDEARALAQCST